MTSARLPAHVEVAGLIRAAQAEGGFATVLAKGERDAGSILILTMTRGASGQVWERLPNIDGRRLFESARSSDSWGESEFMDYLDRRMSRDPDLWVLELDIVDPERFIAETANPV